MKKTALCFATALFAFSTQAAKLAIVIDDVGYRSDDLKIYALPKELSVAIIPSAPYATERAKQAFSQRRDVLIHQPMQPKGQHKIESEALLIGMTPAQVSAKVEYAKKRVPYAIGMNNHMGSAATADRTLMNHLMQKLAQEKLFFLDSRTIGSSVAEKVAKAHGVGALSRHIFLDDSDALANVQRQFQRAIHYARKHGSAIVIGHPRKNTIMVLQRGIASLPNDIQLVSMGSLWRKEKVVPAKPFILLFNDIPATTSQEPFEKIPLLRGVPN
ncbi:divergent polysaccharide deacetylase family protein [Spirabiliibacterium falconis]|uniref:divergent polysaccharide deacetylase family protein n=1 Tax=Spirabiliibacterium falconis TaxID=572023 RepID=UPI001AADE34D|nr:divergent polysaccharide deacetylase family protein [Spirabiliibacterium falconis]MBE2894596.1 divergent polysaccharide deacetylase family protein [Spirabiliibacterium falconis]